MSTLKIERLKRPTAPPPPPPPPPQRPSHFGTPCLTSTPNRLLPIGFEHYSRSMFLSNNQQTLTLKPVKNPLHFDLIVLLLALSVFILCIFGISLFQTKANQFYLGFLNREEIRNNGTANMSETESFQMAAGSELVKQTILTCNGPWFSYRMNSLLMMPFSLILIVVFSFVQNKPHKEINKYKF